MKVMKMGGSCLCDGKAFVQASMIVREDPARKVVVVSAMQGVTDELEHMLERCVASQKAVAGLVRALSRRHRDVLKRAVRSAVLRRSAGRRLDAKMRKLERLLLGAACTGEIGAATRAHVLSYGERLSALLLAFALRDSGVDAEAFDSDEIGIVTDDSFENATALLPAVRHNLARRLLPRIRTGTTPVVTGFFGSTEDGRVTLFGRNGSDYSAAVVARALGADGLELWKDVDGILSADPKLARDVRLLDRLSYMEAAELCHFGAEVLHPRTMDPLADTGIPIWIRSFRRPEGPGTEILTSAHQGGGAAESVACLRRLILLRICGPGAGCRPGIIAEAAHRLAANDVEILSMMSSRTCISFLLVHTAAAAGRRALAAFCRTIGARLELKTGLALVAAVGKGLRSCEGSAVRLLAAAAHAGIGVRLMAAGASDVASYFVVREADAARAVRTLHAALHEDAPRRRR